MPELALLSNVETADQPDGVRAPKLFYIQNAGRPVGNSARWWCVDGHGYTSNLAEAWQVSEDEAASICRVRPGEDIAWPVDQMLDLAELHVDVHELFRLQSANARESRSEETIEGSAKDLG